MRLMNLKVKETVMQTIIFLKLWFLHFYPDYIIEILKLWISHKGKNKAKSFISFRNKAGYISAIYKCGEKEAQGLKWKQF